MAIIGGLITGGAAILGDVLSSSGQAATNQQNTANMLQQEQWSEQMSDTAMQRRVADLKAAGLNPTLAVGQGGASVPSVGLASVQNPNAAFGNLGQTASSAVGNAQAADVQQAQAANLRASATASAAQANRDNVTAAKMAGVDTESVQQSIAESQSRVALNGVEQQARLAQSQLSLAQVQVANAQLPHIQAQIDNLRAATSVEQVRRGLVEMQGEFQAMNNVQFQYLAPSIVQSAANAAKMSTLQIPEGQSKAEFWSSAFGQASPYMGFLSSALKTLILAGTAFK